MKLAGQIILATTVTISLAASSAGALLLSMERNHLMARVETSTRLLAGSIEVSVENALRDGQVPDVKELLQRLERLAGRIDVLVYDTSGTLMLASEGSAPTADEEGVVLAAAGERGAVRLFTGDDAPHQVIVALPLRLQGGRRVGTLVVSRPLDELDAALRDATTAAVGATVAFATTTAFLTALVLRRRFTDPVTRLAEATGRLAEDLDAPLEVPVQRNDELGDLGKAVLRLQLALQRARDDRAREVEHREELQRDLRAADKLIAMGQLASGVAHEIGSPLQVLVGRARLLAESSQDPSTVRQARMIAEHGDRIARIVGRMQDLVRRGPPRQRAIDLAVEVEKVTGLLGATFRQRGVRLAWRGPTSGPKLMADPDEVQQVALNLLLNALQATPEGGRVEVEVRTVDDHVEFVVSDTGRGIEADRIPSIFEPFHTSRSEEGGTGLGLAVVRGIVERHGAQVDVTSVVGEGSTFVVRWPGGGVA